jgi:aminopeptidase YwaD
MLFMGFSAEEIGTVGSQYYVNNPVFPLSKTVAMLNMDMVGRMKDNTITVSGVGTSPIWNDVVKKWNTGADTLTIKTSPEGFGPSDHAQFYGKDIPVLFFFSGTHADYHKPSDDWEKLNYDGEQRITKYVYAIANDIQSKAERPQFTKAAAPASTAMGGGDGRGFSVTLGVVPDYGATVEGMKIDGTRGGGPAEKAGLLAGDVITKFAGKKVLNIYDYMGILGSLKAGEIAEIEVLRDGKPMTFSATMQKR